MIYHSYIYYYAEKSENREEGWALCARDKFLAMSHEEAKEKAVRSMVFHSLGKGVRFAISLEADDGEKIGRYEDTCDRD